MTVILFVVYVVGMDNNNIAWVLAAFPDPSFFVSDDEKGPAQGLRRFCNASQYLAPWLGEPVDGYQ